MQVGALARRTRGFGALAALILVAACGRMIPEGPGTSGVRPTPPPKPTTGASALQAGVQPGPTVASLGIDGAAARRALVSFRESCPRLLRRNDNSGLTQSADWQQACAAAGSWNGDAGRFFVQHFETVRVSDGSAYATGYYEPEISGSRERRPGYSVPVYAKPSDLVRAKAGDAAPLSNGNMPLGRYSNDGRFVPYHDRAQIDQGALAGRGLEIAWAADAVELFFLQIQGSGRLRLPDGGVMRIGYDGQNGQPYTGLGTVMRNRGLIGSAPGQYSGSMQGIMRYLREQPDGGAQVMQQNKSWVFFRELNGDGPLGALSVPVRPRTSVAADPAFVPLGAPVWLDMDRNEAKGLWVAQDTGGAIKGANRFDTFWGAGDQARTIAGGMSSRGRALILVPRGTVQRLRAR